MMTNKLFGWLTPKNDFIRCSLYCHLESAQNHPEVRAIPKVAELLDGLDEVYQHCSNLGAQGEHPEWHYYDMAYYDDKPRIIECLYDAGFIRIGQKGDVLFFEGKGAVLGQAKQRCEDFADGYGLSCSFERRS